MAFTWNPFDKNSRIGKLWKSGDEVLDTGERIRFLYETIAPFVTGKTSDKTPGFVKTVLGADLGGPDSWIDENTYDQVFSALSAVQQKFLLRWKAFEFPITSDDRWLRAQANKSLETWRMRIVSLTTPAKTGTKKETIVTRRDSKGKVLDSHVKESTYEISPADLTPAIQWLARVSDDIIGMIETVAKERKLSKNTVATMSERQLKLCEPEAFLRITTSMQLMGATWMPSPSEKPLVSRMRDLFNGIGPASSPATSVAYELIKKAGALGAKASKATYKKGLKGLTAIAEKITTDAETLRRSRTTRQGGKSMRDVYEEEMNGGSRRITAILKAPINRRKAQRQGPYKSFWLRLARAMKPF